MTSTREPNSSNSAPAAHHSRQDRPLPSGSSRQPLRRNVDVLLARKKTPLTGGLPMRLLGQLTNLTPRVECVLAASPAQRRRPRSVGIGERWRLGNGVVQRAIAKVLAAADAPMRLRDIHGSVGGCSDGRRLTPPSNGACGRTSKARRPIRAGAGGSYRLKS